MHSSLELVVELEGGPTKIVDITGLGIGLGITHARTCGEDEMSQYNSAMLPGMILS